LCDGQAEQRTPPISIIRIAMTLERTGRSMKNFEIMPVLVCRCAGRLDLPQLRVDFLAGMARNTPAITTDRRASSRCR